MLDNIRSFFARTVGRPQTVPAEPSQETESQKLRIAACALLLELAHADEEFTADERRHIEEALARHFDLTHEMAAELIELAEQERREATDLFQFTSLINARYDEGQRMVLAEVLWRVVLADGELSRHEDYLMRKLASLLELRPGYLGEARRRAGGR
jgi:uncharacterized tellurite resistance protein B-like protein